MSPSKNKPARRFRVGDHVSFRHGLRQVTAKIVEDRGPLGARGRRIYRLRPLPIGRETGDFEMPEDKLEPAPQPDDVGPVPLYFDVVYIRRGNTNHWTATTKRATELGPVKARGAVSYTTTMYEGQSPGEEPFAIVGVLVDASRGLNDVRNLADARFREEHPAAEIEHDDEEDGEGF